jgi:SAM-dependent methyltransferase
LPVKLLLAATLVSAFLVRDRALVFVGLCVVLVGCGAILSPRQDVILTDRSFFGVFRLIGTNVPGLGPTHLMAHGTTLHGAEAMANPAYHCRPLVYYGPTTPIGQVFSSVEARKPAVSIGAIGMGSGSVAAYTRPGDTLRFFEIDPLVVRMSTNPANFGYIRGCAKGAVDWVLGDARLTIAREPDDKFDILLVDAFSSDSVPAHLLTVEAMRTYLRRIKPDGVVIMHLSNRNLELMDPVAGVAQAAGGAALQQAHASSPDAIRFVDTGVEATIVARNPAALAPYLSDPRWKPANSHGVRVWTDDYTNLFGALIRGIGHTEREMKGG